jgi:hypothetical protein
VIKKVADPLALISFDPFPLTTIYDSEKLSGNCADALQLKVGDQTLSCDALHSLSQNMGLTLGTQTLKIQWVDEYSNVGEKTFAITRNNPGSPLLTAGMISATPFAVIQLSSISGGASAQAPTLSYGAVLGTRVGTTLAKIPRGLVPTSGATGLTLSIGNNSYVVCALQDETGGCIP